MSPEERQLLTDLFNRTANAAATARDRDAEALIEQAVREQPTAPYYLAQAVIVQEKALSAAADRIRDLERQLAETQRAPQQTQGGGFLNSIFGTGRSEPPVPEPARGGPWDRRPAAQSYGGPWGGQPQTMAAPSAGGSFLRGALGTAAGVAGGVLLANSLSGLFGGHSGLAGIGSPFGATGLPGTEVIEETVINNNDFGNAAQQAAGADTSDDTFQQADYDSGDWQDGGDDNFA